MTELIVRQLKVGTMDNFVYIIGDEKTKEAAVIDSGWEIDPIMDAAVKDGLKIKYAIATHEHFDHTKTLRELAERSGAKVVVHENSPLNGDVRVGDGETLELGGEKLKVLHTPGHTEDGICISAGMKLFTGDTLFIGTCGRTDLPGGSARKLFESLHGVIMKLPAQTLIYPGHDYGDVWFRALEEESKRNPALMARNVEEFLALFG
ncbi:MAG: MBL fold metallo-hydrolase [Thaumarchaeota archaeon]|nr:MBL fold metallo-hydrolase [Nitrososphaerota archaeon]